MSVTVLLLVLSVIENGILAGISFDVAVAKLPTRKHIGPVAYAQFARGNDLGNGKVVYPVLGILALVLTAVTAITACMRHEPTAILAPIMFARLFAVLNSFCTSQAPPVMFHLAETPFE